MKQLYVAAAALLASTALTVPAFAADSTAKQIQMLQEQLRAMQQQLQALQAQTTDSKAALEEEIAEREAKEHEANEAIMLAGGKTVFESGKKKVVPAKQTKVSVKGGPSFESPDGKFKFKLGGRLHLDAAAYSEDGRAMKNGFFVRRARLAVEATMDKDWVFKAQYDFAENALAFKDIFVQYNGIKGISFKAGQYKTPFGLEELTSSNSITFMERSLPMIFANAHRLGLGVEVQDKNYTLAAMAYGRDIGATTTGDDRIGLGARATFAPVAEKTKVIHLGGAVAYDKTDDARVIRIQQRPESRVDGARLVDTGNIANSKSIFKYGLEAGGLYGPFSIQGEYMGGKVKRFALPSLSFNGYYVMGSWVVTGESRGYSKGVFGGVKPSSKNGALELAVRFSSLDLNDLTVFGGKQENLTLGANYYVNENIRFMFNYVNAKTQSPGPRPDDPGIFQVRLQANF